MRYIKLVSIVAVALLLSLALLLTTCSNDINDDGGGSGHSIDDDDDDSGDDDSGDDTDDDDIDDDDDDDDDNEIRIPAGTFWMGCEPNNISCFDMELPRHQVYLSEYYIGTYEVTNRQYANFLNSINPTNNCFGYPCVYPMNQDYKGLYQSSGIWLIDADYEERPVVNVSWYGAKGYCAAYGWRLPTEAEWEKAAKGSSEHFIFPWGDIWIANAANWGGQGDPFEYGTPPYTTPVGYFDGSNHAGAYQSYDGRSPYGVHDMAGNVWEWTNDWWREDYYSDTPPGGWSDPQGPDSGDSRVLRSVGWGCVECSLRVSIRIGYTPFLWGSDIGFRCARD